MDEEKNGKQSEKCLRDEKFTCSGKAKGAK
jgi:hypothetical protein